LRHEDAPVRANDPSTRAQQLLEGLLEHDARSCHAEKTSRRAGPSATLI
jgi:hypothetical protein